MLDMTQKILSTSQLRQLETFGSKINNFGANFAVCNANGDLILLSESSRFESDKAQLIEVAQQILNQNDHNSSFTRKDVQVHQLGQSKQILAAVLKKGNDGLAGLIDLGYWPVNYDQSTTLNKPKQRLADLLLDASQTNCEFVTEMLHLLAKSFQVETDAELQIEKIGTELAKVYEELVLLYKLSANMKLTEQAPNFLQMACDSLTDLVAVEGIAILLERTLDDQKQLVIAAGSGLLDIDERMAAILHSRLIEQLRKSVV